MITNSYYNKMSHNIWLRSTCPCCKVGMKKIKARSTKRRIRFAKFIKLQYLE